MVPASKNSVETVSGRMSGLDLGMEWRDLGVAAVAAFVVSLLLCLALVATRRWHGT